MENITPLPTEIWSQIFLYLDGKSRRSVTATCKKFFVIVRGNEKTSGLLVLKAITLKNLSEKIESEEWNWERWPCLKTLKIPLSTLKGVNPYKDQYLTSSTCTALEPLKLMKFEQCPSLERLLIFDCGLPIKIDTLPSARYGFAREFCVNLKSAETNLSFELLSHLHLDNLENIDCQTLQQIGRSAKQLCRLMISVNPKLCLHKLLDNGLTPMFLSLKGSLKTVGLELGYNNPAHSIQVQALLKSLNENCPSLESLRIKARTLVAREFHKLRNFEDYYCFPNLRELVVPKLHHISAFTINPKNLTTLVVHSVTTAEFKNLHLLGICDKLSGLRNCRINLTSFHQFSTYSKWLNIIDENFQQETKVVVNHVQYAQHKSKYKQTGGIYSQYSRKGYVDQFERILLKQPYKNTTPLFYENGNCYAPTTKKQCLQ